MEQKANAVRTSYARLFDDRSFAAAVERDTAGVENTVLRLRAWGCELKKATGLEFAVPTPTNSHIEFTQFWR
jgi:hypothetical protein